MNNDGKLVLGPNKSANIIKAICELYEVSFQEAADIFYQYDTSELIEQGISDLQCRSDKYLASVVWNEYQERETEE